MPTQKVSAAAAKRRLSDQQVAKPPIDVAETVATYRPRSLDTATWELIRPVVTQTLNGSAVSGGESVRKHVTHLALFYAWAETEGLPLSVTTLTRANIETYVSRGMEGSSAKSRADRRSRLRSIADRWHPDEAAPPGRIIGRRAVRPPYSSTEMAVLCRAAVEQPTPTLRRGMSLCVGLGAGAGLASADFRLLRRIHVEDHGRDGLLVHIPGASIQAQTRRVPIRIEYEDLVRAGLEGLEPQDLLLAGREDRRNLAARAVERAILPERCPRLEQSRLRHTWLSQMLAASVPLQVLLTAAGLQSARTLTDLAALLPPPAEPDMAALRSSGGGPR